MRKYALLRKHRHRRAECRIAGLDDMLGTVSLVATVEGNSSGKNDLVLSSQVSDIWFSGYRYRDLQISGQLSNDGFDGRLNMNDPNARLSFLGFCSYCRQYTGHELESTIEHADLQLLKIIPPYHQCIQVDITGSDINLSGGAVLDWCIYLQASTTGIRIGSA